MKKIPFYCYALLIAMAFSSCASSKKLAYFQNIPENYKPVAIDIAEYTEPVIHPDDVLAININTLDPQAVMVINNRDSGIPLTGTSSNSGYLVDKAGFVEIPVLGKVKLAGMTTFEAKEELHQRAMEFYKDPIVEVRFSNFRVTVLGEVSNPASYVMPNERVTVLDALGYAGDLTVYGKRDNIMLIRKDPMGEDIAVRMDLTDKRILNSPYFYLQQNDVIYVEPSKTRLLNADNTLPRYLGLAATLVTAYVLLVRYTSVGGR